jgi:NAD(P)-dependent dehydrogenase (short-subunit alcohol dehydrogenase family)
MDLNLAGKVAVVTGAGKGIGMATTRALADEGAVCAARTPSMGPKRCATSSKRSRRRELRQQARADSVPAYPGCQ